MADSSSSEVTVSVIGGEPTEEEAAAIAAAIQCIWSERQATVTPDPPMRWRFSGRWWSKPVPTRRARPH